LPRQAVERNYPGSRLSFPSGSAIKRIKAGVKACPQTPPAKESFCQREPSASGQVSFERKKNTALPGSPQTPHLDHWPV
jgi:hypothetical protein